jgi:hypothetical protein
MDERVARLKTAEDCEQFAKNALERDRPDLAIQAHRRAVKLRADAHGAQTRAERECLEAVYAYQLVTRLHHRVRLAATWQMINRRGVVYAVERAVIRGTESAYHAALVEMGLQDLAFEAVVVRHPEFFSIHAVQRARKRVNDGKQPDSGKTTSTAPSKRSGSVIRQPEVQTDRHKIAQHRDIPGSLRA